MHNVVEQASTIPHQALLDRLALRHLIESHLSARQSGASRFAFLHINVTRFRLINGLHGYALADELFTCLVARLTHLLGPLVAGLCRLGGDELGLFVPQIANSREAGQLARRIQASLQQPVAVAMQLVPLQIRVGIVVGSDARPSCDELLWGADYALARAHHARRGVRFFGKRYAAQARREQVIRRDLAAAIADGSILPHFQPVVAAADGHWLAMEALARWPHPQLGEISPTEFIPLAEESGLIVSLGASILRQSLALLARLARVDLKLHVNLAPEQLYSPTLLAELQGWLAEHGIDAERLVLEITESQLIKEPERALRQMLGLRQLGVTLALDDFGTGYAALHCLVRFPLQQLKLDRSLLQAVPQCRRACALLKGIRHLCQELDLMAVVEGVETHAQWQWLQAQGFTAMQGYYFSPAVGECKLMRLLKKTTNSG